MKRIRQKEDRWNSAASGCATGLALGWSNGPFSALQSCALLGAFSYYLDGVAGTGEAEALEQRQLSRLRKRKQDQLHLGNAVGLFLGGIAHEACRVTHGCKLLGPRSSLHKA